MPISQVHFWLEAENYADKPPSTDPDSEDSEVHSLDDLALILPRADKK